MADVLFYLGYAALNLLSTLNKFPLGNFFFLYIETEVVPISYKTANKNTSRTESLFPDERNLKMVFKAGALSRKLRLICLEVFSVNALEICK